MTERVLVVGECLVDRVVDPDGTRTRHVGGSPANVAVGLARLQRPVDLWTCLGDDEDGHWLAGQLRQQGVRLVGDVFSAGRTGRATATLDAAGVAQWQIDMQWTPSWTEPSIAEDVVAVHVGSLGAVLAPGAEQVWQVLHDTPSTWLRSYDVNARVAVSGATVHDWVHRWLSWTDVARASTEDLGQLWPGVNADDVVRDWFGRARRPGTVVLTDGPRGLHRISRFSREQCAPPPGWPVVDTVGAGDAVTAAMIDSVLRHRGEMENWGLAARRAARAGELSVTRAGAWGPTLHELGTD